MLRVFLFLALAGGAPAADIEDQAREVYERIAAASGAAGQPPGFIVHSEEQRKSDPYRRQVAWYDHAANTVGIDRKTLDLCGRTQDSSGCIAVFLGHELAHFYKDHKWGGDFGSRFPGTDLGVKVRALDAGNLLVYETQADDAGGLYSYIAGYDTLALAPTILDKVYAEYKLPPNLPGYPSLTERKDIARRSAARLEGLVPVFEAGNLLLALGRYEDAGRCFDRVAVTLPGGAELNNAGVAYVLAADSNAGGYPWTLDAKSRLEPRSAVTSRSAGPGESDEAKRKRLTNAAEARFSEAIRRDANYLPAILNLAFLEHMSGRRGTARDRVATMQGGAMAESARKIIALDSAPDGSAAAGRRVPEQIETTETMAGTSTEFPLKLLTNSTVLDAKLKVLGKRYPDHWAIAVQAGDWQVRALTTGAAYTGESALHVRLGSTWDTAMSAYGKASGLGTSTLGRWAVFDGAGIAFFGDAKVEKWIVFSTGQ